MKLNKEQVYKDFVEQRKQCHCCKDLKNPADYPEYDTKEIGPWSQWQNRLDTEILLVGQDWGDINSFEKTGGREENENRTNKNLHQLFSESMQIELEPPEKWK